MLGPVFWMELRTRARRRRLYFGRAIVTAGLSVILAMIYVNFDLSRAELNYHSSLHELARLGGLMFTAFSVGQFVTMLLLAPVYCAGCVAGDRERRVLEPILITRLTNGEIVAGKFLVRLLELAMLAIATLPALFFCLLLGGVSWQKLLISNGLLLTLVAFVASVSLIVSILTPRVMSAVVISYVALLGLWVALPLVISLRYQNTTPPPNGWIYVVIGAHPVIGVMDAVQVTVMNVNLQGAGLLCIVVYSVATLLTLGLATLTIRRWGLWASRENVPRPKRERKAAARTVWDNPVAWREVKTIAVHRRMRIARIMALVLLVILSTPVWLVALIDLFQGGSSLSSDLDVFNTVIVVTAVIAWILMALQGSMSFAFERDRSTLDALLTTPLTGRDIILGKLAGIVRSSAFALAFPLMFTLLAAIQGVASIRATLLSLLIIVVGSLLAATWGLYWSVKTDSSSRAASVAVGVGLLLCVGAPLVFTGVLDAPFRWPLTPVSSVSPTVNLTNALNESPNPVIWRHWTRRPERTAFFEWGERVPLALAHVALEVGLVTLFVLLSVRRIERQHRTGPPTRHPTKRIAGGTLITTNPH
jgi:ABC-type transport system involved in multi-copper enzyme maturation permease subunit